MSVIASPFQLLEISLISAQDLAPVSKSIRAYAVAWLDPERKLTTRVDQNGHTNPTWNEKFVFRVDDDFLKAENSTIMIEIYASTWLRDVPIGTVAVRLYNLLPPSAMSGGNRKAKIRFVALQVRRPSGRPQGILNIGVNLLDGTMRSMPIYSDLTSSALGLWDTDAKKQQKSNETPEHQKENSGYSPYNAKLMTLQRSRSEKNGTINDHTYNPGKNGSMCNGGKATVIDGNSEVGVPGKGIMNANGSLCSDVGPSPSVVAAAIAKGIYPLSYPVPPPPGAAGNPVLEDWTERNSEALKAKIERWRTEMPPVYDRVDHKKTRSPPNGKRGGRTPARHKKGSGLFSCIGTAYGCEFSITCGGGNRKRGHNKNQPSPSELTFDESYV